MRGGELNGCCCCCCFWLMEMLKACKRKRVPVKSDAPALVIADLGGRKSHWELNHFPCITPRTAEGLLVARTGSIRWCWRTCTDARLVLLNCFCHDCVKTITGVGHGKYHFLRCGPRNQKRDHLSDPKPYQPSRSLWGPPLAFSSTWDQAAPHPDNGWDDERLGIMTFPI